MMIQPRRIQTLVSLTQWIHIGMIPRRSSAVLSGTPEGNADGHNTLHPTQTTPELTYPDWSELDLLSTMPEKVGDRQTIAWG